MNMAQSSPKEYTYHLEDSKPILFDLYTPESYSPTTNTYKTLILYHGGGLVSANRRIIPTTVVSSIREKNWLVISPDYHLLPESGLQDIRNDAEALENWLLKCHEEIGVDLENVAIGGASSGKWPSRWRAREVFLFHTTVLIIYRLIRRHTFMHNLEIYSS